MKDKEGSVAWKIVRWLGKFSYATSEGQLISLASSDVNTVMFKYYD